MWRSVRRFSTCDCVGVDVATCSALRWLVTNGACQPTCSAPTPPQLRLPPLPCQTRQDLIGYYATWRRPSLSCSVTDVIKTICNSTSESRFLVPPAHSSQSPPPPHTPPTHLLANTVFLVPAKYWKIGTRNPSCYGCSQLPVPGPGALSS